MTKKGGVHLVTWAELTHFAGVYSKESEGEVENKFHPVVSEHL